MRSKVVMITAIFLLMCMAGFAFFIITQQTKSYSDNTLRPHDPLAGVEQ